MQEIRNSEMKSFKVLLIKYGNITSHDNLKKRCIVETETSSKTLLTFQPFQEKMHEEHQGNNNIIKLKWVNLFNIFRR